MRHWQSQVGQQVDHPIASLPPDLCAHLQDEEGATSLIEEEEVVEGRFVDSRRIVVLHGVSISLV